MFILFFPSILLAQERQEIKVFGVTTVSLNVFYLNIKKDKNIIEVSYKIQDSLSSKVKYDKDYIALNNGPKSYIYEESTGAVSQKYLDRLGEIFKQYYIYTKDSLQLSINKYEAYSNLISDVIKFSKGKIPEDTRSILDGTSLKIDIIEGNITNTIQLNSPDKEYSPLIAKFITETFDLFRKGKNDKYLTQKRTSGY
ncbi:hypothetical protein [Pedobacter sp.]|uniref:hypothetical protein n=1 Tax=Pedobacter sp. TaxID=1411316 RepID=UPI003BAB2CE2